VSGWSSPTRFSRGSWAKLSPDLRKMYLSHYARFGDWSATVKECYDVGPAVQIEADKLRAAFVKDPRHENWLGDWPGTGR
jgi:hypothetical protein